MKISKLFHWLYATLMFLPLVFFIPSCLYYSFNEHATNTETTTINYKYESNEVNSLDDLVEGHIYYLENFYLEDDISIYIYQFDNFHNTYGFGVDDLYSDNGSYIQLIKDDTDVIITLCYDNLAVDLINYEYDEESLISFTNIVFLYSNDFYSIFEDRSYLPQYTDYNVIESVSVNTDDTITDKLNRSWNAIFDLPMFSWTKTTFVSAPFTYITGLFGLASDNPINYLFGYFASISICWLIFDLVLYVPNLAHRWLDRSALE